MVVIAERLLIFLGFVPSYEILPSVWSFLGFEPQCNNAVAPATVLETSPTFSHFTIKWSATFHRCRSHLHCNGESVSFKYIWSDTCPPVLHIVDFSTWTPNERVACFCNFKTVALPHDSEQDCHHFKESISFVWEHRYTKLMFCDFICIVFRDKGDWTLYFIFPAMNIKY